MGIEPATRTLRKCCSTTELHRLVACEDLTDLLSTQRIIDRNHAPVKRFLADWGCIAQFLGPENCPCFPLEEHANFLYTIFESAPLSNVIGESTPGGRSFRMLAPESDLTTLKNSGPEQQISTTL